MPKDKDAAAEAAFARPYSEQQPGDRVEPCHAQEGMTMRQWYAGQALAGVAAVYAGCVPGDERRSAAACAARAFALADAMLELAQAR